MKKYSIKWWIFLFAVIFVVPLCVLAGTPDALHEASVDEGKLIVSSGYDNVSLVHGDFNNVKVQNSGDVLDMLDDMRDTFKFSSSRENLAFEKTINDVDGLVYRFNQVHNGYRVYGAQLNVSTNKNGYVSSISGKYFFNLEFDDTINYKVEDALKMLENESELSIVSYKESVYYIDENSTYLTYVFSVAQALSTRTVFISSRTLKEVRSVSEDSGFLTDTFDDDGYILSQVETTQKGLSGDVQLVVDKYTKSSSDYFYILADSSRNIWVTDAKNASNYSYYYYQTYNENGNFLDSNRDSRVAVEGFMNLIKCYDFFADPDSFGVPIVGLKNMAGQPIKLIAIVHYGSKEENAGYVVNSKNASQGFFVFGDGDYANGTREFVRALDVVGHEYTHCITDSITALEYFNESGALCEAYADIFGSIIEGHSMDDPKFWRMGEDLFRTDVLMYQNKAYRDMSNPRLYDCADSCDDMFPLCHEKHDHDEAGCDNGGVHHNSTIATYATYLMYCQDPEFFNEYNILRLWYKTLTKLTEKATFKDFADAMVQSATELDGGTWQTNTINEIKFAFASVGIEGYKGEYIWGNNTLTALYGSGTPTKPYIISDAQSLASAMYYINNLNDEYDFYREATYQMSANISLEGVPWTPIGTSEKPFEGMFNGSGYTISDLNLKNGEQDFNGLFGFVGKEGYIVNVNIGKGSTEANGEFAGAIVGNLMGTINNCSSRLSLSGKNVGGLVGLVDNSTGGKIITDCYADCNIVGDTVGGLASYFATSSFNADETHKSGMVSGSYFAGKVSGNIAGGFFGLANGVMLINNISVATLEGATKSGYIGKIAFKNVYVPSDTIKTTAPVLNMFLNCYFAGAGEEGTFGILFGSVDEMCSVQEGNILIDRCIVKKIGENEKLYNNSNKAVNIIEKDTVYSADQLYSGAFNFDDINFFKEDNFIAFEGASTFDTTVYRVNDTFTMPVFVNSYTWTRYASNSFNGGDGSAEHPYEIDTAEQLALLAYYVTYDADDYADKNYILTSNIDLEGRIWMGIGYSVYTIVDGESDPSQSYIVPFTGTFDGKGHTIFNLTSVGMASSTALNLQGTSYRVNQYGTALFGVVSAKDKYSTPVIKNVRIEDAFVQGSIAGAVVGELLDCATISNVSVIGGKITASQIAGGVVGLLGGGTDVRIQASTSIDDCFVDSTLSGKIVGGAVGYAVNSPALTGSTLSVKNFLLKGTTRIVNMSLTDNAYESEALFGGVVGGLAIDELLVTNNILMGKAMGYTNNSVFGGFVGKIGSRFGASSSNVNIDIKGSKLLTAFEYVLSGKSGGIVPFGVIVGTIDSTFASGKSVSINVSSNTHTSLNGDTIYRNYGQATINSSIVYNPKSAYTSGPFDFYNRSIYASANYFEQDSVWTDSLIDRMYIVLTFLDDDGNVIKEIMLKEGETLDQSLVPTVEKASTQVHDYIFNGWNKSLDNITRSMTLRPNFDDPLRNYTVTYVDENGNTIEERTRSFGSSIEQDVKAPEKKSSLFFSYKFTRWGKKGQIVLGNTIVKAEYKKSLTGFGIAFFVFLAVMIVGVGGTLIFSKKNKKVKRKIPFDEQN